MIPTEEFLVTLKEIDALRFGDFTLASGAQSQFYLDLRYLPAFPDVFSKIITKWAESLTMEFDLIVGIPSAGIPFATALAWVLNKP
ncbi:MAG: orotate phosphoribosyltransferase, partial [Candidatus Kariarchaeaceae archaeon]